jgi:hypothetical protein
MTTITLRSSSELRIQAHLAAKVFGKSLNALLIGCLHGKIAAARKQRPSLFEPRPLASLKPVDRTIYNLLTAEGRCTVEDLMSETGLPRKTIKPSLLRLIAAGYIGTLEQGRATEGQAGAQKLIYISLAESQ